MNPQAHAKFDLEAEGKRAAIRRTLADAHPARLSTVEIAAEATIVRSTAHRLCGQLIDDGELTVERVAQTNHYRLVDPEAVAPIGETTARELIERTSDHSHRTSTAPTDGGER